MKFIPNIRDNNRQINSIIWSQKHGIYISQNSGDSLGNLLVDYETAVCIENGNTDKIDDLVPKNSYFSSFDYLALKEVSDTYRIDVLTSDNRNDLPYGVFKLSYSMSLGIYFRPFSSTTVDSNIIPNKNLKDMIRNFYNEPVVGRKNKKGFLLYGPPGNGKTTEIMQLFPLAEEMKLRIILVDKKMDLSDLGGIQKVLEKERTIFVLEEVTERIARGTEDLLTFLDGENSWNNAVVIATTNHPEELPANLVDRPGRFDTFIEYTNPTRQDIIVLASKFGFDEEQVKSLFGEKLSFDYVSFILAQAGKTSKSITTIRQEESEKRRRLSSTFKGKMGLGGND